MVNLNVFLNQINGIDDALVSFTMTRRIWTPELDKYLRDLVNTVNDRKGFFKSYTDDDMKKEIYNEKLKKVLDFASDHINSSGEFVNTGHITLISFIDLSVTVEGLHYAGVADLDSHAYRFHNRILRTSSRAKQDVFSQGEFSEYYKDKVISTDDAAKMLNIKLPDKFVDDIGNVYVKTVNGYVNEDYEHKQDVKRGLYMLGIPSNCIFRCNLLQFCHIYQQRNYKGHANPEVQKCVEMIAESIEKAQPLITREYLEKVHQ